MPKALVKVFDVDKLNTGGMTCLTEAELIMTALLVTWYGRERRVVIKESSY